MSRSARLIPAALASALLIGAIGHALAEDTAAIAPRILTDVRRQIDAGLYLAAVQTLRAQLASAEKSGTRASGSYALLLLLAEVYYRSGRYDDALAAAEAAGDQLAGHARRYPEQDFTAERLDTALWQARIELARGKSATARRPPADPFHGEEIRPQGLTLAWQADLLELLVLRAELTETPTAQSQDAARWNAIRHRAEARLRSMPERPDFIAARASTARSLARCLEAERHPDGAVLVLRDLLGRASYSAAEVKAIWSDIARIHHRAQHFRQEAEAWREVLRAEAEESRLAAADGTLAALDRLNAQAVVRLDLAEALHRAGSDAQSADQQQHSARLFQQVLDRIERARADAAERAELGSRKAVALQGLLQISQAQRQGRGLRAGLSKRNPLTDARDLHQWLLQNRLADDPIVHQVEANLGARYIRVGDHAKAREKLEASLRFFAQYPQAPAATVVQVLVLLAEINRVDGMWHASSEQLESAAQCYRQAGLRDENLWLWLQVYRGRLAAAHGAFAPAEAMFLDVVRRAEVLGDEGAESANLARLSLSMLYKGFGRLEQAETQCRAALENHRRLVGGEDRELLPYHLALAGILILRRQPEAAGNELARAQQLAGALPRDADEPRELGEVRHLAAMLDMMRYESGGAESWAEKARQEWTELYVLQQRCHWPAEQARTCYYLSRLALLRWQREVARQAPVLRAYDTEYKDYEVRREAYTKELERFRAQRKQYVEKKEALERKDTQDRQSLAASLERDWADLARLHGGLQATQQVLAHKQTVLNGRYSAAEAVRDGIGLRTPHSGQPWAAPRSVSPLLAEAEAKAREAIAILEPCQLYPSLHYVALCHCAEVLRARAVSAPELNAEVRARLEQAVALLEQPRVSFAEGDLIRAEFLSQYTAAFDQLVAWHVENHHPAEALVYAELCRSRTFLDRIRGEGYDPMQTLPRGDQALLRQAEDLARQSAALGQQLQATETRTADDAGASRKRQALREQLQSVHSEYEKKQEQILQKSSLGHAGFGKILSIDEVRATVQRRIRTGPCTLYYHVGAADCYLFVLGVQPEVRAVRLSSGRLSEDLAKHVSAGLIGQWAEQYAAILSQPGGFRRTQRDQEKMDACVRIAQNLLPSSVLKPLIQVLQDRRCPLLISPDGALQQIPFEALLLEGGDRPQFLIDRLPPTGTLYAPSLMIVDALKGAPSAHRTLGVLTVGSPAFSRFRTASRTPELADLPDLQSARRESNLVAESFRSQARPVRQLLGAQATKRQFRAAIAECRPGCLHVATHAVALDLSAGGATALVLCPGSESAEADDDGLLKLSEIYMLPLRGCELAVLSACRTTAGRSVPREMAMTVARAFLAAGTRRVVASQWEVDDRAGCEFVRRFFDQMAPRWQSDQPYNFASAVQAARQQLRQREDTPWSDPYFWSSFVLIGSAD